MSAGAIGNHHTSGVFETKGNYHANSTTVHHEPMHKKLGNFLNGSEKIPYMGQCGAHIG